MNADVVELGDVVPVVLPKRSRLYCLPPVLHARLLVESLTSYVARLAAAHCLPVWVLVTRELTPLFSRKTITQPDGHCDLLGKFGASINGNNATAQEAAMVAERLTGQVDLGKLTMVVAGDHLASTPLMRPTQAWCPQCLDEWAEADQHRYYPLLWNLAAVRTCPVHWTQLVDRCCRCTRSHQPLARRLRIGYCPWCQSWLGDAGATSKRASIHEAQATEWECHAAEAAAKLLAALSGASQCSGNGYSMFAENISAIVERLFNGSINALANFLQCDHGTIGDWVTKSRKPSLNSLLVLTFRLNIPPSKLLLEPWDGVAPSELRPAIVGDDVRLRPPLRMVARDQIERILRTAIDGKTWPPPSLRQVCVQGGFHQTQASQRFPQLARRIMELHRSYRSERRCQGEQRIRSAVRTAVSELHTAGVYPSHRKVRMKLGSGVSLRDAIARAEREAAMKDLGLVVRTRAA